MRRIPANARCAHCDAKGNPRLGRINDFFGTLAHTKCHSDHLDRTADPEVLAAKRGEPRPPVRTEGTLHAITPDIGQAFMHKGQLFIVHSWAKANPNHDPSYQHVHATRREATHVHGRSGRGEVVLPISDVRIDSKYDHQDPQLADRRKKVAGYAAMEHPIEMMTRFGESGAEALISKKLLSDPRFR